MFELYKDRSPNGTAFAKFKLNERNLENTNFVRVGSILVKRGNCAWVAAHEFALSQPNVLQTKWIDYHLYIVATVSSTRFTKFESYKGNPQALGWLELDSTLVQSDDEKSLRQLAVQLHQIDIGLFIPVLGFAPQVPEIFLPIAPRIIVGEVLVNGTPCAVQSTCNPTVDQIRVRSIHRRSIMDVHTHDRRWLPHQRRTAYHKPRGGEVHCRHHGSHTHRD